MGILFLFLSKAFSSRTKVLSTYEKECLYSYVHWINGALIYIVKNSL
jgi:hypothetical protein